jgi:hypothetical protein
MSLLALWKSNPDQIRRYAIRQIVAVAGDGRIRDDSACSAELREFLQEVTSDVLQRFANECLDEGFDGSGFVLQDVVNEIGRRLEFETTSGLYRGKKNAIGFDGIWRSGGGLELVVEVKTTDTYNVNLDQVSSFRNRLIDNGALGPDSSVLFVVGRQDTGALEAQIRGSRHAWTMRVIGASSLIRLLKVKEKSDSSAVVSRIKALLRPVEYTRVDGIVDLMFDATADVEAEDADVSPTLPMDIADTETVDATPSGGSIEAFRRVAAEAVSNKFGTRLIRRRRSLYSSANNELHVSISVSKRYERDAQSYWYAYYTSQQEFLESAETGLFVLGALDLNCVYAIPAAVMKSWLPKLNTTNRDGRIYWHVKGRIRKGDYRILFTGGDVSISEYRIPLKRADDAEKGALRLVEPSN